MFPNITSTSCIHNLDNQIDNTIQVQIQGSYYLHKKLIKKLIITCNQKFVTSTQKNSKTLRNLYEKSKHGWHCQKCTYTLISNHIVPTHEHTPASTWVSLKWTRFFKVTDCLEETVEIHFQVGSFYYNMICSYWTKMQDTCLPHCEISNHFFVPSFAWSLGSLHTLHLE